jgi:hypothetical protein
VLYERGTNSRTAVVVVQFFRKRSAFGIIIVMSLIINMRLFKSVIFSSKDYDSMEPTSSSMKIQCQLVLVSSGFERETGAIPRETKTTYNNQY